jgi:1-acyl-sn-glycerol-3-phosphate acyltransferase
VCALFGLREPLVTAAYGLVRLARRILGIRLEVSGLDRLDRGTAYVFMANHLSLLDGPAVMAYVRRPCRVILKKSILRIPVLGLGMRYVGFVPVDRQGTEGGKRSIARAARWIREHRYSFLIFPEGTRSPDGRLGPFRRGGFFLALESGAPIVPVTIRGTREVMPKGRWLARPGRVEVVFHGPVPTAGLTVETMPELMDKVRAAILGGVPKETGDRARRT